MRGWLSERIDKAFRDEKPNEYRSSRIGASIIGNPCEAYLAFQVRGFPEVATTPRFKRIFRDGHRIEKIVLGDLKKAGHLVNEVDPMTGKQYMWSKYDGFVVFYADGIIEGVGGEPAMLLEVKSMAGSLWDRFKTRGLQVSHPKYYDQLQLGMGMSGYRKGVLIAYNKDTSEYWDQTIEFDEIRYHFLLNRATRVLMGYAEKIATDPTDWRCKSCPKKAECWDGAPVVKDMKTCANANPGEKGFVCSKGCKGKCEDWVRFEPKPRSVL